MSLLAVSALIQLAAACPAQGVPDARMVAHARIESGLQTTALHDNTSRRSYAPATVDEAVALARPLLAQGHSLDAGVLQINNANWSRLGLTVETAFDPALNVCAGKQVLAEAYALERRVSCRYNTGKPDCTNGYPDKIEAAMREPVEVASAPAPRPVEEIVIWRTTSAPSPSAREDAALPATREASNQ